MNTLELVLLGFNSVAALVAVALSARHHRSARGLSKTERLAALGKQYAVMGWAFSAAQPDSAGNPKKARKHAEQGFIIADTSADGKRDFNDKQVAYYLDASKPE
jgi:hypothetical protein